MSCGFGAFHEDLLPDDISHGMQGGPELRVEIATLQSGIEERDVKWTRARRRFNLSYGIRDMDDVRVVETMFIAHDGAAHPIRVRDWGDYSTGVGCETTPHDDVLISVADMVGNQVPIYRTKKSGGRLKRRRIYKPRTCGFGVAVDGVPLEGGWSLDASRGVVHFSSRPRGTCITWGGLYDTPVRFDAQSFSRTVTMAELGEVPGIDLIEVLGDRDAFPEGVDDVLRAALGSSDAAVVGVTDDLAALEALIDGLAV